MRFISGRYTALFCIISLSATASYAASTRAKASVEIMEPSSLQQISDITVQDIPIPTQEEVKISVESKNSKDKNKQKKVSKQIYGGEYVISGTRNNSFQLGIRNKGKITGLDISSFTAIYDNKNVSLSSSLQNASGQKHASLHLGANLTISNKLQAGFHRPSIDIDVSFE